MKLTCTVEHKSVFMYINVNLACGEDELDACEIGRIRKQIWHLHFQLLGNLSQSQQVIVYCHTCDCLFDKEVRANTTMTQCCDRCDSDLAFTYQYCIIGLGGNGSPKLLHFFSILHKGRWGVESKGVLCSSFDNTHSSRHLAGQLD